MPWYLYLAFKQLFPSGKRWPSFYFVMGVVGVMLGVTVLVIVQSVMGGFGHTHREKIILTSGHIDVRAGGNVIYNTERVLDTIEEHPAVTGAVPYATGIVMMTYESRPAFPFIIGIDVFRGSQVVPLEDMMIVGSLEDLDDDSILLSAVIASQLGARVGDSVEIFTPLILERLKNDEVLLPRELRIAGIYESGWNPFDSTTIISGLRLVQDLYEIEGGIHGVSVRLNKDDDELIFKTTAELDAALPAMVRANTWMDLNEDFLWVLAFEKNMMLFLLLIIVIVASFAIAAAQLLNVMRKTREIGLMGALGAQRIYIAAGYCFQGFLIGLLGTVLGIALALTILYFRDPIVETLATLTQSREILIRFYQFAHLPVHYSIQDFVVISVTTLIIATLAAMIPAIRAAMMRPAEALRNE